MAAKNSRTSIRGTTARRTNGIKGHRYQGSPFDVVDDDIMGLIPAESLRRSYKNTVVTFQ